LTDPGTSTYTYDAADQLTQINAPGGPTNLAYDAVGNLTQQGATAFTYDLASRMTSTTTAGVVTGYRYDGDNKRVDRTTNGTIDTKYEWDTAGGLPELALERNGAGTVTRRWVQGPTGPAWMSIPTGAFSDPTTYYYHRDHLGSVTDLTNSAGASLATYAYEPFGAQLSADPVGAPANPLRFTGEYLDSETQDYHLRARQYSPTTGRFGGTDPLTPTMDEQWVNPYAYVDNMPGVYVDPTGMSSAAVASQVARAPRVALPGAVGRFGRVAGPAGTAVLALTAGLYIGSDINNWAYGDDLVQAAEADARGDALQQALLDRVTAANAALAACAALAKAEGKTVGDILEGKKGSIKNAELPSGSPSWDSLLDTPMSEIEKLAKAGKPGFKTIKKLLTDKRFNKK
jgi:RHS repeat-associated protein